MRNVLALVVLLLAAPVAASAQEASLQPAPVSPPAPSTELVASTVANTPEAVAQPVRAEARKSGEATAARDQMPSRGSFWWLVGVIVVAGVILAVLL